MGEVLIECIGIVLAVLVIIGFVYLWEGWDRWRSYRRLVKRDRDRERDQREQAQRRARGSKW
jgi:threonine/homoserine/homoserine lactone efflux protein